MTKRYKVGEAIRYFDTKVIITEVDDWGYHGINASIPFVAEKYCTLIKAETNIPNENANKKNKITKNNLWKQKIY